MSLLDTHPAPKPGAHWPDGFRERAQAIADRVAAERRKSSAFAVTLLGALAASTITPEAPAQERRP